MSFFSKEQEENILIKVNENFEIRVPEKYNKYFSPFTDKKNIQHIEYKNFIDLTKNKNVFIDVGCHVGAFLFAFNSADINKNSFGFDINPQNLDVFKDILKYNSYKGFDNITYYQMGIDKENRNEKVIILGGIDDKGLKGLQGIYNVENKKSAEDFLNVEINDDNFKYEVKSTTIDNFSNYVVDELKLLPDVIKIDVEGYEEKVLDGGYKTFTLLKPLLFIEIHSNFLEFYNSNIDDVYSKIIDYNYEFYDYNRKKIESLGEYQSLFENNPELRIYCLPKLRKGQ